MVSPWLIILRCGLMFFDALHEGVDRTSARIGVAAAKIASELGFQPKSDMVENLQKGSVFSDLFQES